MIASIASAIRSLGHAWLVHLGLALACLGALDIHTTYRVPAGPFVLVLPWLGVAAIALSALLLVVSLLPAAGGSGAARILDRMERRSFWTAASIVPIGLAAAVSANKPWVAVVVLGTGVSLAGGSVAAVARRMVLDGGETLAAILRRLRRVGLACVSVFLVWSAVVLVNEMLDRSAPVERESEVLGLMAGRAGTGLGDLVSHAEVRLRSWRFEGYAERLVLAPWERERVWIGEPVIVHVRAGALGIPWVSAVTQDEPRYLRQLLTTFPGAIHPLKRLIKAAIERRQWDEAIALTHRYAALYPGDPSQAQYVAGYLETAARYNDGVELLRDAAERRPDYNILCMLAVALDRSEDHHGAIRVLNRAVQLKPGAFLAFHFLGEAYAALERREEAIKAYEAELAVRPQSLEVRRRVKALRDSLPQH